MIKKLSVIVGALLFCAVIHCQAQGNTVVITNQTGGTVTFSNVPPNQVNFFAQAFSWVTTRYASGIVWPVNDLDAETGANYASQTAWDNFIALTKNIGSFYIGGQMDNAGVGGVVEALGARSGYTLSNGGDLRVKGGLYGGYRFHDDGLGQKGGIIQPELGLEKAMTGPSPSTPISAFTFISIWIYYPIQFHGQPASSPGGKVAAGVTF